MPEENFLRADPRIIQVHDAAEHYAYAVNKSISMAHEGVSPYPFCGEALHTLAADAVGLHRAILSLCAEGWAFAAISLLRSMMELCMNAAIIVEQEPEAEYRGFKYTHFFLKAEMQEKSLSPQARAELLAIIKASIRTLPASQQQKAQDFMFRECMRGYWYAPEYSAPTEVLDKLSSPVIKEVKEVIEGMYRGFSGGAHGGYLGLRLFKDEPDTIHPNQRTDPKSQNRALASSARILIETMNLRDCFENSGQYRKMNRILVHLLGSLAFLV